MTEEQRDRARHMSEIYEIACIHYSRWDDVPVSGLTLMMDNNPDRLKTAFELAADLGLRRINLVWKEEEK